MRIAGGRHRRTQGARGDLAIFGRQGHGCVTREAIVHGHGGGTIRLDSHGRVLILRNHRAGVILCSASASQRFVHGIHHGLRGHGRAGQGVNAIAQRHRSALAHELIGEICFHGHLAQTGRFAGSVHRQGSDRAALRRQGNDHIALEASLGGGQHIRTGRGGGAQRCVHSIHRRLRGDGRAGQGINAIAQREGAALAHELVDEVRFRHQLTQTGGFVGRLEGQLRDRAALVQGQLSVDVTGKALGRALVHIAGQGRGRSRGLLFLRAEGHQRIDRGLLAQGDLGHAVQRVVGGVQDGGGGDGRAGQRVKGAAVHRINARKLALERFILGARTKAGGLGKVGIADGAGRHDTVGAHAQIDGHSIVIAVLAGGHAVADHFIAVLGGIQGAHVLVFRGNGQLLVAFSRHDRAEGFPQGGGSPLLNGAAGDHVGQRQRHSGDQGNDAQNDESRELLAPLRRILIGVDGVVFHCTKSLHHRAKPFC